MFVGLIETHGERSRGTAAELKQPAAGIVTDADMILTTVDFASATKAPWSLSYILPNNL
ncbi:hypothetical protein Cflav_PD4447 [Pedosphaera parvula Ellin514]|uniref:Uncharacterized protein n=1 Tax=Pedosphaera parvula (strain Ellin514) TaxID=320771 RepID=B9XFR2_PEDPL|nr:hypothetical protein Cflav_PD4447 [Pedosphaera parvula Ellin514]